MRDPLLTGYRALIRPVLFGMGGGDPEVAHEQALRMLQATTATAAGRAALRLLHPGGDPVRIGSVRFDNRVGLAAGLDKRAEVVRGWSSLGFGHVELGTVTPQPQPGNPRPRVFRLPASGAVINRMGFPSGGAEQMARRLDALGVRRGNRAVGTTIGISIGKNKQTPLEAAVEDYLTCFRQLAPHADYIAVNVSSPNTPGLRELQDADALTRLLGELTSAARQADPGDPLPILVKLAPDLTRPAVEQLLAACEHSGISGLIAGNTTTGRDGLAASDLAKAVEAGGLSGHPLTRRAREVLGWITSASDWPVIGVGGIMTPADARAMFDAGARLVQLYTGWIYSGPALVNGINRLRPGR